MTDDYQRLIDATAHLPGVEQSMSWGTPSLVIAKKMMVRCHEDPGVAVIRMNIDQRAAFINAQPDRYFLTDHYRRHPYVLARIQSLTDDDLYISLTDAWLDLAPTALKKRFNPRRQP